MPASDPASPGAEETSGTVPTPRGVRASDGGAGSGGGGSRRAWSSNLSVPELAAIRGAGYQPAGFVLGASVYRFAATSGLGTRTVPGAGGGGVPGGAPFTGWGGSFGGATGGFGIGQGMAMGYYGAGVTVELEDYEAGIVEASQLALDRMIAEARDYGAHGIVGVRIRQRHIGTPVPGVDFFVTGTAVVRPGEPSAEMPFSSHLSGQDFAKLIGRGYEPRGFVLGIAAVRAYEGWATAGQMMSWRNTEVTQLSQVFDRCTSLAVERMESDARAIGDGVVGVELNVGFSRLQAFTTGVTAGSPFLEALATGTAVARVDAAVSGAAPDGDSLRLPLAIMRLADRKRMQVGGTGGQS